MGFLLWYAYCDFIIILTLTFKYYEKFKKDAQYCWSEQY